MSRALAATGLRRTEPSERTQAVAENPVPFNAIIAAGDEFGILFAPLPLALGLHPLAQGIVAGTRDVDAERLRLGEDVGREVPVAQVF